MQIWIGFDISVGDAFNEMNKNSTNDVDSISIKFLRGGGMTSSASAYVYVHVYPLWIKLRWDLYEINSHVT